MLTTEARVRAAFEPGLREQVWEGALSGVEGGEEVVLHGGLEGFDGLVFNGADLDDAGGVDEDVDTFEVADGELDRLAGRGLVGEVGGKKKDVVGISDVPGSEEGAAGLLELVLASGDEDEAGVGAAVDAGELEAKAGGAPPMKTMGRWRLAGSRRGRRNQAAVMAERATVIWVARAAVEVDMGV